MVQRRQRRECPAAYATAWPDGALVPGAPLGTGHVLCIARNLAAALDAQSLSAVARQAEVNRSTLQDLLAGRVWPEALTVAKLELVLGVRLWPDGTSAEE